MRSIRNSLLLILAIVPTMVQPRVPHHKLLCGTPQSHCTTPQVTMWCITKSLYHTTSYYVLHHKVTVPHHKLLCGASQSHCTTPQVTMRCITKSLYYTTGYYVLHHKVTVPHHKLLCGAPQSHCTTPKVTMCCITKSLYHTTSYYVLHHKVTVPHHKLLYVVHHKVTVHHHKLRTISCICSIIKSLSSVSLYVTMWSTTKSQLSVLHHKPLCGSIKRHCHMYPTISYFVVHNKVTAIHMYMWSTISFYVAHHKSTCHLYPTSHFTTSYITMWSIT